MGSEKQARLTLHLMQEPTYMPHITAFLRHESIRHDTIPYMS
jgi:hypothetical protein